MTNNNDRRDLDQSDVQADSDHMFSMFLNWLWEHTEEGDDTELLSLRYLYGDAAREGDSYGVTVLQVIDFTRARNHIASCPNLQDDLFGEDPFDERDYDDDSYTEQAFYGVEY